MTLNTVRIKELSEQARYQIVRLDKDGTWYKFISRLLSRSQNSCKFAMVFQVAGEPILPITEGEKMTAYYLNNLALKNSLHVLLSWHKNYQWKISVSVTAWMARQRTGKHGSGNGRSTEATLNSPKKEKAKKKHSDCLHSAKDTA